VAVKKAITELEKVKLQIMQEGREEAKKELEVELHKKM